VHNFTRECQSHWHKNSLPHIHYVATIPCASVRHKSNTFRTIFALCTCLYRLHLRKPVLIKQTKHSKSNCPLFPQTHAFKRLHHCNCCYCDDGVVQQLPLAQHTFYQLFHIMDPRTVDPLLKDTPDAVVHRIQIWQIGWPNLWRDKLLASLSAAW